MQDKVLKQNEKIFAFFTMDSFIIVMFIGSSDKQLNIYACVYIGWKLQLWVVDLNM